jgi:hypothetical protein
VKKYREEPVACQEQMKIYTPVKESDILLHKRRSERESMKGFQVTDMKKKQCLHILLFIILIIGLFPTACTEDGKVISKPDEFTHVYEANEEVILGAITQVFKEKGFGNAKIAARKGRVESDYTIQDDWRSKSIATVKKMNWKESEVTLSVITEKKTSSGWEMRRKLEKKHYDIFFDAIGLQIFNEIYKVK